MSLFIFTSAFHQAPRDHFDPSHQTNQAQFLLILLETIRRLYSTRILHHTLRSTKILHRPKTDPRRQENSTKKFSLYRRIVTG